MLSAGMFTALALSTAVRRRGFEAGSPPPSRAAMDISRMIFVKILPRLASSAPFLCLMECHLECPDIASSPGHRGRGVPLAQRPAVAQAGAQECSRGSRGRPLRASRAIITRPMALVLPLVFTLSGAAALLFETLWF